MTNKDFLFIVNPNSGIGKYKKLENILEKELDSSLYKYKVVYTEYAGHAKEIAKLKSNNYDVIVAVGGDGSINEVGQGLVGGKASLGIIPVGSGNGLARSLKIPLNVSKAIKTLLSSKESAIDIVKINQEYFLNVAGIGFDANVGHLFDKTDKRGFLTYVKIVFKAYFLYKSIDYELIIDGKPKKINAFLVSFANSNQWGNNFYISPLSRIEDGLLEVCVLKPFSLLYAPFIAFALFSKTIHKLSKAQFYSAKSVVVKNKKNLQYHIDGEPKLTNSDLKLEVIPKALSIVTPL
jgi:YegS/Rv2252/BmrU family lipid kinase